MANSAGVSGPFNPTLGTNLAQNGTAAPACVIGYSAANPPTNFATWQRAALGAFIGEQGSANTARYSQAQGDVPPDFDPTFVCTASHDGIVEAHVYTKTTKGWGFDLGA